MRPMPASSSATTRGSLRTSSMPIWWSPPTASAARLGMHVPRCSALGSTYTKASISGPGQTSRCRGRCSLRSRTEYGTFVAHAYPYAADRSTFLIETDEETWRRAGFDVTTERLPFDASDEDALDYLGEAFRRASARASADRQPDPLAAVPHGQLRTLARRQRRSARRRGPHRALLDRVWHQARDGGRHRAGRGDRRRERPRGGAGGVRAGTAAGRRTSPGDGGCGA